MATALSIEKQAERLATAISKIIRNIELSYSTVQERRELTKPQMLTLLSIVKTKKCKMSDLSKLTGMALSALTGIVDRLIDKGFVRRERDLEDRRIVKVVATERGTAIANEYYQVYLNDIKKALSRIGLEDRENFVSLFEKIASSF